MAASYPTSTKSFSTKTAQATISESHVNDIQDEVVAIENGLRTGLAHDLLPDETDTRDLGATGTRWQDLFLSGTASIAGTGSVVLSHASGASVAASAGPLTLKATTSVVVELDTDNNGSETFSIEDGAGTAMLTFTEAGTLHLNDSANAKMTIGLTVNQGANDDEAIALKSSDVAHGITDLAEADTYGALKKQSGTAGGVMLLGLTDTGATAAVQIEGVLDGAADTNHNTSGAGIVFINSSIKSGTGKGNATANGNLLTVANNGSTKFIVDAEGDTFQDGTAGTAYSDYDDPMLALAVEHHINPKQQVSEVFQRYCTYNKQSLVDAGILAPDGPNGERGFVNMSALTRLAIGGLWQLAVQLKETQAELAAVKRQMLVGGTD